MSYRAALAGLVAIVAVTSAHIRGGGQPAPPASPMSLPSSPRYPPSKKTAVSDTYHGVRVPDPYRWLEDAEGAETLAWVDSQNRLTRAALDGPFREGLERRLAALHDYARAGGVSKHGSRYFYTCNSGLQNQDELVVLEGADGEPRVLLDPNALSPDGTIALTSAEFTDDGRLLAYGLSQSGSDRQEIRVRDVATARDLSDRLLWSKFASVSWLEDGSGFYYTRFPEPGTVPPGDENYFCRVYFHRLGDDQSKDALVFERPDDREIVFATGLAAGDRFLLISGFKGASDKSDVHVLDRRAAGTRPLPLFAGFADAWAFVDEAGGRLFFRTDRQAPRGRIVSVTLPDALVPLDAPAGGAWPARIRGARVTETVPEQADKLSAAVLVRGRIVASYLHDAHDVLRLFSLDGAPAGDVDLPSLGSISSLSGRPENEEFFVDFESFTAPATPYRFRLETRVLAPFVKVVSPVDPRNYETSQVWYPSRDGTKISMFLVRRRGLVPDGRRPVLLYGYGGFNISLTPAFDASNFVWLDAGGVFALANLRGGGEYGEAWHEAGMLERKQNVFDDFIAAAEWLVASGYTSPMHLAIEGGSNGGLLVAAVEVQRPDLFGAVVCRVPVADMLRYHLFTVGRFWIPEYGSSDDPEQFAFLYRYSPLHNVKDGVAYPPTLVMTADTDDRVAPGMAKKFAARLQAATAGPAPILLRVETKAGHGAGKPVSKIIDEDADILAFLFGALRVGS